MATTPPGAWLRLHVGFPGNRKVRPLSDAAFRLFIEVLCWAKEQRTDGLIEGDIVRTFGRPPKVWKELRTRHLLDDAGGGDLVVHGWAEWQEPVAETDAKHEARRALQRLGGTRGNHIKWHLQRGMIAEDCAFCIAAEEEETDAPE